MEVNEQNVQVFKDANRMFKQQLEHIEFCLLAVLGRKLASFQRSDAVEVTMGNIRQSDPTLFHLEASTELS